MLVLGVVGAGAFLSGLELMITAVALPAIVVDLADWTELRAASWIINGYLLVSIVVMPLAGQLADRHGVRRVFLGGLVIFVAGSILAGRATGLGDLVAARLVQALGGGSLVPAATAAASHLYAGAARPRALGTVGALTFLGMAAGPFAGAWIMQSIHPAAALAAAGVHGALLDALGRAVALRLLPQRADRRSRCWLWAGRPRQGGPCPAGRAGSTSRAPSRHRSAWPRCCWASPSPAASRSRVSRSHPRC